MRDAVTEVMVEFVVHLFDSFSQSVNHHFEERPLPILRSLLCRQLKFIHVLNIAKERTIYVLMSQFLVMPMKLSFNSSKILAMLKKSLLLATVALSLVDDNDLV